MIGWLRRLFGRDVYTVSSTWLAEHAHRGNRIEFHGVAIRWPIRKLINENTVWNKAKLKRSA